MFEDEQQLRSAAALSRINNNLTPLPGPSPPHNQKKYTLNYFGKVHDSFG
jgi:hypothetical protein